MKKQYVNLLNGRISTEGISFEVISPIDHKIIGNGVSMSSTELKEVFKKSSLEKKEYFSLGNLNKLATYITENRATFINQIIQETGYIKKDVEDIVDGSIEFVTYFRKSLDDTADEFPSVKFSYAHSVPRKLLLSPLPYGLVAAMTPQNAPLILELTVLLNVLAAGNSVILRPSSQSVGTASLLIEGLVTCLSKEVLSKISIISCKATEFLDLSYEYSDLIHYIGSSHHGKKLLVNALENNVKALVDGEGSSTVVIDPSADLFAAVDACYQGIIRCNGELCSTVRTIVVEETVYEKFCTLLRNKLLAIKVGNPLEDNSIIGPLFHHNQAENLRDVAAKYEVIVGNISENDQNNAVSPMLIKLKKNDKQFLHEEVFGPIAGIASYTKDEWKEWLHEDAYPLNNAVFSNTKSFIKEFITTSYAPRIVINNDPSIESAFEPWGAFLPSGQNEVSTWYKKYVKKIQIDAPEDFIV